MKSIILLAIVIASLIGQSYGGCQNAMLDCVTTNTDCASLRKALKCFEDCGAKIPDQVEEAMKKAGCGASALTNLGLPVMLLIGAIAYFNK